MKGGSAPRWGASADFGDQVERKSSATGGQDGRSSRFPPVSVAALQRLPGSSARSFAIGVALGRWIDGTGSSARLTAGKAAAGSLVDPKRLPAVLEAIGITPRTWREYVNEWEGNYLAHRCGRATVCLFTRPLQDRCPACEAWIDYDHPERPAHLPRGPGFRNGAINATRTALSTPLRGTNSAVQDRSNGTKSAVPEHDSATPKPRGFYGKEVGRYGPELSILDGGVQIQDPLSQAFTGSRRLTLEAISGRRLAGFSDRDIAALLNGRPDTFAPPKGFARWTGYAVRVVMGEAIHAA